MKKDGIHVVPKSQSNILKLHVQSLLFIFLFRWKRIEDVHVHCELFKRRKLSERVKKSQKIGTQLGIEPRTF